FSCILPLLLFPSLCVEASSSIKEEVEGGYVTFPCSFILAENNNKYFCKDPCSDILVETKGSRNVNQGRYSIEDNGNGVVTVTIKDLKKSDSGTYKCGVERVGVDTYQEVYLTVTDGKNNYCIILLLYAVICIICGGLPELFSMILKHRCYSTSVNTYFILTQLHPLLHAQLSTTNLMSPQGSQTSLQLLTSPQQNQPPEFMSPQPFQTSLDSHHLNQVG
uniref:Immunoglobulin domain-containing protein n=1 Tax=Esox lucius TaxID=8010 RepID=A0AAY5KYL3_ESOLU